MFIVDETNFLSIWLEGFLYGLYSGIFAIYSQCPSKESRTANILFCAVGLLYVLSTAAFVSDLVALALDARFVTLSPQLRFDSLPMLFHLSIVQTTANGCCDFLAQCILICRCWIMWDKNICVVIVPSFLAIAYLALWLGNLGAISIQAGQDLLVFADWGTTTNITGLATSMAVNLLVTGLIVFKILKVFLEVNPILVELTLDSNGGTKLRHIIFVIIESGMALFAIQLVRLVFTNLPGPVDSESVINALDYIIVIHQMLNGIAPTIILVRVSMKLSFDDMESFKEVVGSLGFANPPSDPNLNTCSMPPQLGPQLEGQERSEDT